jgi:hypothetical protein
MNKQPEKLWDPKYAAIGVVAIALSVFILDFLPGIVRAQIVKRFGAAPTPEPQSLKAQANPEPSAPQPITNPYTS